MEATHLVASNYLGPKPRERRNAYLGAFLARDLSVVPPGPSRAPSLLRFGLVNFRFFGTNHRPGPGGRVLPLHLLGPDSAIDVIIEPLPAYESEARHLSTLRGVRATSELVVELGAGVDTDAARQLAHDLCLVLSVARGTKIQWIYEAAYDEHNELALLTHAEHITKPYGALTPLDYRAGAHEHTKAFVEAAYPRYWAMRERYRLAKGTIDAYLDAKAQNDYLEMRGVKLVVALEVLKNVWLEQPDCPVGEFIMEDSSFRSLRKQLAAAVTGVLAHAGVSDGRRAWISRNLAGLNRTPFFDVLRGLCASIDLRIEDEDLRAVIDTRNSLIHTGRFHLDAAIPQQRRGRPLRGSAAEEFFFLLSFVDRCFLRLFGYDGQWIDWSSGTGPQVRPSVNP